MIEIYCGDGKGKTTAAVGLAVRAAGRGIPVVFIQFLKSDASGEIHVLRNLPRVAVYHAKAFYGFTKDMNEQQKAELRLHYEVLLQKAEEEIKAAAGHQLVLVLDEAIHACNKGLLEEERLVRLLEGCPENVEVVLTGREPSKALTDRADYISRIEKVRHPYDKGIPARKGIEL